MKIQTMSQKGPRSMSVEMASDAKMTRIAREPIRGMILRDNEKNPRRNARHPARDFIGARTSPRVRKDAVNFAGKYFMISLAEIWKIPCYTP